MDTNNQIYGYVEPDIYLMEEDPATYPIVMQYLQKDLEEHPDSNFTQLVFSDSGVIRFGILTRGEENTEQGQTYNYTTYEFEDALNDDYFGFDWYTAPTLLDVNPNALEDKENSDVIILGKNDDTPQKWVIIDKENGKLFNISFLQDETGFIPIDQQNDRDRTVNNHGTFFENILTFSDDERKIIVPHKVNMNKVFDDLDFNKSGAINQIITGETGCGKTYKAVNDEIQAGNRFVYIAPCRQLVYETYRYYADKDKDALTTGEAKYNMDKNGNLYAVYESLNPDMLKQYDTLIIDEAHFINDQERGGQLLNMISASRENGINVKLLTATQNFRLNDFDEITLPAKYRVPKKVEISSEQAYENIKKGMQTIIFARTIDDTYDIAEDLVENGISAAPINSSISPSERLQMQIDFENQKLQCIVSTNVLAQGLNFVCQNMIIMYDSFTTSEMLEQKIGRLGRPGTLKDVNEVYFATAMERDVIKKPKSVTPIRKSQKDFGFVKEYLNEAKFQCEWGEVPRYNDIKYCIPEFRQWCKSELQNSSISPKKKEALEESLKMISDEQNKLLNVVLSNMRDINQSLSQEVPAEKEEKSQEDKLQKIDFSPKVDEKQVKTASPESQKLVALVKEVKEESKDDSLKKEQSTEKGQKFEYIPGA